ncbi:MAG: hypothetical protein M3O32_19465, partial [Actinomycetota bacterium]|nr:hypothetical protein [Actinomycetota bacterium]
MATRAIGASTMLETVVVGAVADAGGFEVVARARGAAVLAGAVVAGLSTLVPTVVVSTGLTDAVAAVSFDFGFFAGAGVGAGVPVGGVWPASGTVT